MREPQILIILCLFALGCTNSDDVTITTTTSTSLVQTTVSTTTIPLVASFEPGPDVPRVFVDDELLNPQLLLCGPTERDGKPSCGVLYQNPNFDLDEYSVIVRDMCPGKTGFIPKKVEFFNTLDGSDPPKGVVRSVHFCQNINQFWVFDYEYIDRPLPYWYGPFDGYPIQRERLNMERLDIPFILECELLNSSFWRALCYDEAAYERGDDSYCQSIYCRAKFHGAHICTQRVIESLPWKSYRQKACEAWAKGSPYFCDNIMKSGECIRWWSILDDNLTLCQKAQNTVRDDCGKEFAFWRGDLKACEMYNTKMNRRACEGAYYQMMAIDKNDTSFCTGIQVPKERMECMNLVGYRGDPEKHPLYLIEEELSPYQKS